MFNSYGLALILFGIVIKLVLFPVTLKSKKSMIQTTMLSGRMQQLQKQYGKDKERYNLELQKLYEREKVNPMGGCLWSLIPMIVLIALFSIIREPLTYFMHLSVEQIQALAAHLDWETVSVANGWVSQSAMEKLQEQLAEGKIASLFQHNAGYNQMYLVSLINSENLSSLQSFLNSQFAGAGDGLFVMNFQFLGLDLSKIPTWKFWAGGVTPSSIGLFILPIISVAVSYLSMKVSMATNQMNSQTKNAQMDQTNKMMMWMMPLMSLWIGFTVPAGLSVYWITQYFVTMIQEVICGKMLKKDYEAARQAAEKREAEEKEEEKRRKEEARLERQRRIEEEKKNKGKKKPKKKDDEPEHEGINKADSREGLRAYARGRAYIPNRYGGVTPYTDPNQLFHTIAEASQKGKKKNKPVEDEKSEKEIPAVQLPETPEKAPLMEETAAPVETEEIEVEVEEIEVEVDEDKEG
ncbi:MAG: YidC/Oxa1 family membrane protein insertase [Lawsonibacter sp.]|nr:YidC/Oxa1 family membrane protein insertase [Lawsonibacter sp.]